MAQFDWPGDLAVKGSFSSTGTMTGIVAASAGSTFTDTIVTGKQIGRAHV